MNYIPKWKYNTYNIVEIPELWINSYTQPNNSKFWLFQLDNIYFKDNEHKIWLIQDLTINWNYVIFDTETNGLNQYGESLPFQIAAIRYRWWEEVSRFEVMINIWDIPENILELTHFKQEDINAWISLIDAIKWFSNFVRDEKYIIAHNADFDIGILNNALVATDYYIWQKIQVLCSMQMYYAVYKHIFELWISWSSINQLSIILLWINLNNEKRHQAEYDVEITKELLDKIGKDIQYDLTLGDNSAINKVYNTENYIKDKINLVKDNYNTENIKQYLNDIAIEIDDIYNDYQYNYYNKNLNIANAVSIFLEKSTKEHFPEIFLEDELNNITYYIKKNKPFEVIDEKYANTWIKNTVIPYSSKWDEVSFFKETSYIDTDITDLDSSEALAYYIKEFVKNKMIMMKLQMKITYRLKILKAHQWKTWNLLYWDWTKWIKFQPTSIVMRNNRMINKFNIERDINKWLIKTTDDLLEVKDYNTTLIVEQNLSNIFNLI